MWENTLTNQNLHLKFSGVFRVRGSKFSLHFSSQVVLILDQVALEPHQRGKDTSDKQLGQARFHKGSCADSGFFTQNTGLKSSDSAIVVCSAFPRTWNHVAPISQGPACGKWHGWRCLQGVHGGPFWSHLVPPLRFLPIFSCYFMTLSSLAHPPSACISGANVFKILPQS